MAYLSDDELLDTEGGFTGWDDGTGAGAEETLEQALAEERLAELESELEQDEHNLSFGLIHHRSSYLGSLQKSRCQSMTLPHQQSICIEGTAGGLLPLMG